MSEERDEGIPPWDDMPEDTREMIRAEREAPGMTPEEMQRAVQRALAVVAAVKAAERPVHEGGSAGSPGSAAPKPPAKKWLRWEAITAVAGLAAAAMIFLWLRRAPEEETDTAKGPDFVKSADVRKGPGPVPGTASAKPTAGPAKDAGPDGAP